MTITHLGDQVGDVGLVVATEPRFFTGEKVRVYLVFHTDGSVRQVEDKADLGAHLLGQWQVGMLGLQALPVRAEDIRQQVSNDNYLLVFV